MSALDNQIRRDAIFTMAPTLIAKGMGQKDFNVKILDNTIYLEVIGPSIVRVRFTMADGDRAESKPLKGKEKLVEGELLIKSLLQNFKKISLAKVSEDDSMSLVDSQGDAAVTKFLNKNMTQLFNSEGEIQAINPALFTMMIEACSPERRVRFAHELIFSGGSAPAVEEYKQGLKELFESSLK